MWLPSSIRRLVLFAFPILSTGCHAWRMERPLPVQETFLDLGTPIAPQRELVEVNAPPIELLRQASERHACFIADSH